LAELNALLLHGCQQDQQRRYRRQDDAGRRGDGSRTPTSAALAREGFELAEISFPKVDSKSCVKVRTNWYSTPVKPGLHVQARLLPAYVEVWQERKLVARHERSFARYEQVLALEHYLDVLLRKPVRCRIAAVAAMREHGHWPESFDQLWQSLQRREGKQAGTRSMIELLQQGSQHGWEKLKQAVRQALDIAVRMRQRYGTFWSLENWRTLQWSAWLWADWNATNAVAGDEQLRSSVRRSGGGGAMKPPRKLWNMPA